MSSLITLGPQFFPLSSVGAPAGGGSLYIGDVDTDPTVVGNQKTTQALTEAGDLITLSQPITLSAGGIPLYAGSPVSLYTSGDYSLTVLDINGAQVYYIPSTPGAFTAGAVSGGSLVITDFPNNNNLAQFDGSDGLEDSGESISEIGVLDTAAEWTARQNFNTLALTSSGNAVAWNLSTAQMAVHVLTENTTISAPSNMVDGITGRIRIVQAAGVFSLAWNGAFEWGEESAPGEPAANGDIIIVSYDTDGTTMYAAEFMRVEA